MKIFELEEDYKEHRKACIQKSLRKIYDKKTINFRKDLIPYAEIEAAAKRAGLPANRFISIAVIEKIERDGI